MPISEEKNNAIIELGKMGVDLSGIQEVKQLYVDGLATDDYQLFMLVNRNKEWLTRAKEIIEKLLNEELKANEDGERQYIMAINSAALTEEEQQTANKIIYLDALMMQAAINGFKAVPPALETAQIAAIEAKETEIYSL